MSFLKELKEDYRATWLAYQNAEERGDKEAMTRLSSDLVRIADAMERER